jgi:hypothetical protein
MTRSIAGGGHSRGNPKSSLNSTASCQFAHATTHHLATLPPLVSDVVRVAQHGLE